MYPFDLRFPGTKELPLDKQLAKYQGRASTLPFSSPIPQNHNRPHSKCNANMSLTLAEMVLRFGPTKEEIKQK